MSIGNCHYELIRYIYNIRNLTSVAVVVEDIATREEQEDLANVLTFIKLRRKSNPNKL